jgi:dephospho-CoA kinase
MALESSSKPSSHRDCHHVFGIAGPIAAGKTTIATLLRDRYGYSVLSFGEMITALAKERELPELRRNLQVLSEQLIDNAGYAGLLHALLQKMDSNKLQVVDGIRHPAVAALLRERFGAHFTLVYVDAPLETRYRRGNIRAKFGERDSLSQFRANQTGSIESAVRLLKAEADFRIRNTSDFEAAAQQVADIVAANRQCQ